MVSHARRKELAADLRGIFAAPERRSALKLASSAAEKWRKRGNERVAGHIEERIEECLSCLAFPESHRRRIRTTNRLERLNQEIKRRSRMVRIFPNPEACLRLVTALAMEQSEEWITGRRYLDMEEIGEHRRIEELVVESEEAMIMKP
jgi:putative transposase